jgi:DNA-binding NarL/FixJ family response regulator
MRHRHGEVRLTHDEEELRMLYDLAKKRELLTPRELQVLRYWSCGYGIRQTAFMLTISVSTVRTHRRRLYEKLEEGLADVA